MNILFIAGALPYPPDDGWRTRVFNLIKHLSDVHSVTVVCFADPEADRSRIEALGHYCRSLVPVKRVHPYRLADLIRGLTSPLPFIVLNYRRVEMVRTIHRMIHGHRFDLVQVEDLHMSSYLEAIQGIPRVLDLHNVESILMHRYRTNERNLLKRYYAGATERRLVDYEASLNNRCDICLSVSRQDADCLLARDPQLQVEVVPNGVDTTYFRPMTVEMDAAQLVFTGHMAYPPNVDAVLYFAREIFPIIHHNRPAAKFIIVGKDPTPQVRALARQKGIQVTGPVPDVRLIMAQSSVFAVPLRMGGGTRLKILEAMAMGKPVVSTSIGCEGLDLDSGEHLVVADEPQAFADACLMLMDNEALRNRLASQARRLVEDVYDWSVICRRLSDIYQSIELTGRVPVATGSRR
jgi:sugar transferase (PEP-CTERM/EpsH1 system associated)